MGIGEYKVVSDVRMSLTSFKVPVKKRGRVVSGEVREAAMG